MNTASTYSEYKRNAERLDAEVEVHRAAWRADKSSPYFNSSLLDKLCASLRKSLRKGDARATMRVLRFIYSSHNVGGIDHPKLYSQTHTGTKEVIEDFIQLTLDATRRVAASEQIPLKQRVRFFRLAKRMRGRTALVLSGGASMGYYHLGTLSALFEAGALPKVISGTSAGAMIASLVCVRTDEELPELFTPDASCFFTACEEPLLVKVKRWLSQRSFFDHRKFRDKLRSAGLGDLTFREAYERSGRILNISMTSAQNKYVPPVLLNHITAPNVTVWSAVLASCAIPHVLLPIELVEKIRTGDDHETQAARNSRLTDDDDEDMYAAGDECGEDEVFVDEDGMYELRPFHWHGKTWSDGTIKQDIPIEQLRERLNCNYFIVSQTNPHVVPFFYNREGSAGEPSPHHSGSRMRGGFLLSLFETFIKLELSKWLQLVEQLDLLPLVFGQDWRYVFLQTVRGTVTISPRVRVRDYLRLINDPTRDDLAYMIKHSQRRTWPKLSRIVNHFVFERVLRECEKELSQRMSREDEEAGADPSAFSGRDVARKPLDDLGDGEWDIEDL